MFKLESNTTTNSTVELVNVRLFMTAIDWKDTERKSLEVKVCMFVISESLKFNLESTDDITLLCVVMS